MKNIFKFFVVAAIAATVACGPSAAEKKAAEQKRLDSLKADSIAKVEKAAAEAKALEEQKAMERAKFLADSLHQDSIAKKLLDKDGNPIKKKGQK